MKPINAKYLAVNYRRKVTNCQVSRKVCQQPEQQSISPLLFIRLARLFSGFQSSPSFCKEHSNSSLMPLSGSFVMPGIPLPVSLRSQVSGAFRSFPQQVFFLSFSSIWPFLKFDYYPVPRRISRPPKKPGSWIQQ